MKWSVELHPEFAKELADFSDGVQDRFYAEIVLLEKHGPQLQRPHADTLRDSKYSNMKELRFNVDDGVWRVAFAFDPERKAILLVAGDKSGVNKKKFYDQLIKKADKRFDDHLQKLKESES